MALGSLNGINVAASAEKPLVDPGQQTADPSNGGAGSSLAGFGSSRLSIMAQKLKAASDKQGNPYQ